MVYLKRSLLVRRYTVTIELDTGNLTTIKQLKEWYYCWTNNPGNAVIKQVQVNYIKPDKKKGAKKRGKTN